MRLRTILLLLVSGLAAGIWDASLVTWLPSPLSAFRIVLPIAVVCTLFGSRRAGLLFTIAGGCATAVLLPSTGGWIAIRYAVCVIIAYELSHRVFANRTLFGVTMLGAIAAVSDRVLQWLLQSGTRLFSGVTQTSEAGGPILGEVLWCAAIVAVAFMSLAAFTRRFLPTLSHFTGRQIR